MQTNLGASAAARWTPFAIAWLIACGFAVNAFAAEEPPREWLDPATGHRIVRLSNEPNSQSLYFHQYPFSANGKKMVFTSPKGIESVNLETRAVEHLVDDPALVLMAGRKTGNVYHLRDGVVYAVDFDTHETREVVKLPKEFRFPRQGERFSGWGNIAINADESLVVGIGFDPNGKAVPRKSPDGQPLGGRLVPGWSAGQPKLIFTVNIATGEIKVIHRSNDWLNHLQCSPTDPEQILFCHEGPWHFVDRIWTIRTDGSELTQVHPRTIDMEIAGHEFFSADGKLIWYDLQTPRSLVFWLAGYNLENHRRTWYHLERSEWSVHYNISPDGKLFSGDGGGPNSVANLSPNFERLDTPGNGQWIYLFRPELIERTGLPENAAHEVQAGMLKAERLVDLSKHDYDLEPNGIFSPDGKWLIFRSNMHGPSHVYAVEIAKTQ